MANEDVKTNAERVSEIDHCIDLLQSIKSVCLKEAKSINKKLLDQDTQLGPMYETAQDIFDALKSMGATVVENLQALSYQYQVEVGVGMGNIDSFTFSQGISAIVAVGQRLSGSPMTGFIPGDAVLASGATSSANNAIFTVISTNAAALYTATPMVDSADSSENLLFKLINRTL